MRCRGTGVGSDLSSNPQSVTRLDPHASAENREDSTMKFMLMMNAPNCGSDKGGEWQVMRWPPEDLKAHIGFMKRFAAGLQRSGELVAAEGLASPGEARIVRAQKSGKPEVTDGPFAESKEFLAGYWIVDVETKERAYEIAAQASAAP